MQIKAAGHGEEYSVYTVLKSFFWFENVTEKESDDEDICVSTLREDDDAVYIDTEITYKGKTYVGQSECQIKDLPSDELSYRRVLKDLIKKSAYNASKNALGSDLKWGILTGIRPVKVARDLRESLSYENAYNELVNQYYLSNGKSRLLLRICDIQNKIINDISCKDISLYISIPFCVSRCSYCSFVSHSIEKAGHLVSDYVSLLIRELTELAPIISSLGLNLKTIYIGGGTPTSLNEAQLEHLLTCISDSFDISRLSEYTLEAGRADTITEKKLLLAKRLGVDRVSINPQTTNDVILSALGRRHTRSDFMHAFHMAKEVGFKVINTDVIAGLPGESLDSFKRTIDDITALSPENVTVHTLSVKRGSSLNYNRTDITREFDLVNDMLEYSSSMLDCFGYEPYYMYRQKSTLGNLENVGYSKPGYECLYNIYMMEEVMPVFGAGAGAVYKLLGDNGKIDRLFNYKYPYEYVNDFSKVQRNHNNLIKICN